MTPNLHFNPDSPGSLETYLAGVRGMLPAVDALISRYESTELSRYVGALERRRLPALQCKQDFIAEVVRQTSEALGPDVGALIEQDLLDTPQVLTANHHGIDTFAQSTQSNLLFSLRRRSDGTPMRTVPVLACGSVPLNNLTYPRGLLIYAAAGEDSMLRLPIFPDSAKRRLVSVADAFTLEMLERARIRADALRQREKLDSSMASAVGTVLDEFGQLARGYPGYGKQATVANSLMWRRLFRSRFRQSELVYIELESVVGHLLEADLFDSRSICHQLLFDPELRRNLVEKLDGQRGCWQHDRLAGRRANSEPAGGSETAMGTMFFWGVDSRGRQVPLYVAENGDRDPQLRGVAARGDTWGIPLTPESILREVRQRRLLPSIFTSYLLIAIARGISCVGGYYQADYLPTMRQAVFTVLHGASRSGDDGGEAGEFVSDWYLSGMQTIGIRAGDRLMPAGPLEMIACGGLDEEQYARIGEVTVYQSHVASLFDIVMDVAPRGHDFYGAHDEIARLVCSSVGEKIVTISMQ